MKRIERDQAISLRKEGKSIREIYSTLNVSKGSVSRWVREIKLSNEQSYILAERIRLKGSYENRLRGADVLKKKGEEKRKGYREVGYKEARYQWLHVAGCMLYWAEGYKKNNRYTLILANSDPNLLKLFIRFLVEFYGIKKEDIKFGINCYTDCHSVEEIKKYWMSLLLLSENQFYKTTTNVRSKASKGKNIGSLEYGTGRIVLNRYDILNRIYGSIQKYSEDL